MLIHATLSSTEIHFAPTQTKFCPSYPCNKKKKDNVTDYNKSKLCLGFVMNVPGCILRKKSALKGMFRGFLQLLQATDGRVGLP